jgi:FdhE protein
MALVGAYAPWEERRTRATELRGRLPFAGEVLNLYLSLLEVQERAFLAARKRPPPARPDALAAYICEQVLPGVVEATVASGPEKLVRSVVGRFHAADLEGLVRDWLEGRQQTHVDRYLARAASAPVLEAAPDLLPVPPSPGHARLCPSCGGLPQVAFFGVSGEALVTAPRYLLCSRCLNSWTYPRLTCAACGETEAARLPVLGDPDRFPHLRIDGCQSCRRYLLTVELPKDGRAVPLVDELAALPLDLYARDRGFNKIIPNLMGF